jgi:hypothetical protein
VQSFKIKADCPHLLVKCAAEKPVRQYYFDGDSMLIFEWNPQKAKSNLKKHGISFEEASTSFQDTVSLTIDDPLHSIDEKRLILIGMSQEDRLLVTYQ